MEQELDNSDSGGSMERSASESIMLYFIQVEISEYNVHMDCRNDSIHTTFVKAKNIQEAKNEYERITGDIFLETEFIEDTDDEYITKKYKVIEIKYGEPIINSSNEFNINR